MKIIILGIINEINNSITNSNKDKNNKNIY